MNATKQGVLRGIAVAHDAHVLLRPGEPIRRGAETTAAGAAPARDGATPPAGAQASNASEQREDRHASGVADGYREGFHAGFQQGLDEGRASGLQQGLDEGRAQGLARAREEAQAREQAARTAHAQQADRFGQLLAEVVGGLQNRLTVYARQSEEDMIALCHRALCRVFGEAATHRESAALSVRQALAEYCSVDVADTLAALLTVRVHPADAEHLQADLELAEAVRRHGVQRVTWVGDEQVVLGGCFVDSVHGRLDARLETQLAALTAMLSRSATPPAGEDA